MGTRKTIAVIGGGASGTLTAYQLVKQCATGTRVVLVEPRAQVGLGLAYSTPSLRHLLNVPAGRISGLPDEPGHFLAWLQANHDAKATADTFAPRAIFGRYLQSLLAMAPGVEYRHTDVVAYEAAAHGAALVLRTGERLQADVVVLATGNFRPAPLRGISAEATATGVYCHNAWDPATYERLDRNAPVTLIGTGLTGVDVLLRLREQGHCGVITAISRHGIFPTRHAPYERLTCCAIASPPPTALAYLRAVRRALREGTPWRAVIDSLRAETNRLWLALPHQEQLRFRRHLQRRWDVVRHRMPLQAADVVERELAEGTLLLRKGNVHAVEAADGEAKVQIQTVSGVEVFPAGRVINCTCPDMDYSRVDSPLLRNLLDQGVIVAGSFGRGVRCDSSGAVCGRDGRPSSTLFIIGPGRLGTLLESIAIPEIRQQAMELATMLAAERVQSEEWAS